MFEKEIQELKNAGISPSKQRRLILNYLNEHCDTHNTVDDIFRYFRENKEKLSLATIYNTISLFKRKNLVSSVSLPNGEVKYERDVSDHIHFECKNCGDIYNMNIDFDKIFSEKYSDFLIEDRHTLLRGICPKCK